MRDGKECGLFMLDNLANFGNPNMLATYYTRQIILAKMHAENYARSNGMGARLLAETYTKKATEEENSKGSGFTETATTAWTATAGSTERSRMR